MRKTVKAFALLCVVLFVCSALLACNESEPVAPVTEGYLNVSGRTLSETSFYEVYMSDPAGRDGPLPSMNDVKEARISHIAVKDGAISLTLNIGAADMTIDGKLYASARKEATGINCIVADGKCSDPAYEVLYFGIWNDSAADSQLGYEKSLESAPHIQLYLRDTDGMLSLFEFAMPEVLSDLDAADYAEADDAIDLLWPLKIKNSVESKT